MFGSFDFQEFLSAFIVLFAVIDIIGSIPIILNLKQKGRNVNANKATGISFALLIGFFYAGDMMLKLFQVDIASFAVAGAFVIFSHVFGNDSGYRDIQESRSYQGSDFSPLGFSVIGWCGSVYYVAFPTFGVCSCKYCCSLDIEYGLGLCSVEVDRSHRTFLGERWNLCYS